LVRPALARLAGAGHKLGEWGKYLGDATVAAAILDRLAMTSIHIDIDGPSYREHLAKQRAKDRGIVDDAA
jgi:hypothetical protein